MEMLNLRPGDPQRVAREDRWVRPTLLQPALCSLPAWGTRDASLPSGSLAGHRRLSWVCSKLMQDRLMNTGVKRDPKKVGSKLASRKQRTHTYSETYTDSSNGYLTVDSPRSFFAEGHIITLIPPSSLLPMAIKPCRLLLAGPRKQPHPSSL